MDGRARGPVVRRQHPGPTCGPYDRLIGAALDGDRWLFARQDTVEAAWRVVDPVLGDARRVHPYARGSWGPKEADDLLPDGDTWHDPAGSELAESATGTAGTRPEPAAS